MYLDVWKSGTFLLHSCKAVFWIQETSPRLSDVKRSVVVRSMFAIGSTLAYLLFFRERVTSPHIQVRHCMWLSFFWPFPHVNTASDKHWGEKAWVWGYYYGVFLYTAGIELYERLLAKRRRHKAEQKEAMRKDRLAEVSLETSRLLILIELQIVLVSTKRNCNNVLSLSTHRNLCSTKPYSTKECKSTSTSYSATCNSRI